MSYSKVDLVLYKLNNFQPIDQYDYNVIMEYARLSGIEGEKARDAIRIAGQRSFQAFRNVPNRDKGMERNNRY